MLTNLHIQTEYSFMESLLKVRDLIPAAKRYHYQALPITDTNNMYGTIKFYRLAREAGIKPLIGTLLESGGSYLLLLARNNSGFSEMNRLITEIKNKEKPAPLTDLIRKEAGNLYILSPYPELVRDLKGSHNKDLFLELPLTWPREKQESIIRASRQDNIPFIPTYPAFFFHPGDLETLAVLAAIRHNTDIHSGQELVREKEKNYLISLEQFTALASRYPDSLKNIERIVESCDLSFDFNRTELPEIRPDPSPSARGELARLCYRELERTGQDRAYAEQLRKELDVIRALCLDSYFLIVREIACYARKEGISYTGRGSAANSLVCYLLGITHVDPVRYGLFFERFLHIKRDGFPDIDLDFPWNKRDRIISFIYDRFNAALIGEHVRFNVRGAIRETAKTFGLDEKQISRFTKRIPFMFRTEDLSRIQESVPELKGLPLKDELWQRILACAERIIGLPHHISIHPGGMVIAKNPLHLFTALEKAPKGFCVTQLDMYDAEKIGLLKIDILGQRSLAVMDDAFASLQKKRPPDQDAYFHDQGTIELIRTGRTIGCFYIESPAMRQLLKKLKVKNFEELTAASSVIRPGVAESGMMQKYIRFHNNPGSVQYIHPVLKELLSETYGIMIYQEDVIKVAVRIAGFRPEDADILRKSMSGKTRSSDSIRSLKEQFITGCLERHYPRAAAEELWSQIESFAGYAFCKAHSASYARISFVVAFLKAHYPAEFLSAVISNRGGFYSAFVYVEEARRMGLRILPPDVNRSGYDFIPGPGAIRPGLSFIKGFPSGKIRTILAEREQAPFSGLPDFCRRCDITETEFLLLAKAGCLDWTGYTRKQLIFLAGHVRNMKGRENGSGSLFGNLSFPHTSPLLKEELSLEQRVLFEIETLGFSVSDHPLILVKPVGKEIIRSTAMAGYADRRVWMHGIRIFHKQVVSRKKDKYMKFISFMDRDGTFETFLSASRYEKLVPLTLGSPFCLLYGRITEEYGACTLNLEEIVPLDAG
ncbi:MAG: DNA polymerase III subunit alpha [bacterium]|nr:DNA polymerase III subunit alpha [bacterium]